MHKFLVLIKGKCAEAKSFLKTCIDLVRNLLKNIYAYTIACAQVYYAYQSSRNSTWSLLYQYLFYFQFYTSYSCRNLLLKNLWIMVMLGKKDCDYATCLSIPSTCSCYHVRVYFYVVSCTRQEGVLSTFTSDYIITEKIRTVRCNNLAYFLKHFYSC